MVRVHLQPSCPVLDVGLPLLGGAQEAIADAPLDVELVRVFPVLDLPPRDDDVGLVAELVLIHRCTGSAAVVEEELSVAPGLILVSDDVVLQVTNLFPFPEGGCPAALLELER